MPKSETGTRSEELTRYIVGFGLSVLLTAGAFVAVGQDWVTGGTALWVLAGLALAQIVVQLAFFLHIDLKRSHRDDLQLVLYTILIIGLMVGGSAVILFSQHERMDHEMRVGDVGPGSY